MKRGILIEDDPAARRMYTRFCLHHRKDLELTAPGSLPELEAAISQGAAFDIVFADSELKQWQQGLLFYNHPSFPALIGQLPTSSLVISTSGRSDAGHELCDRASALGARCTYVGKPFDPAVLKQLLQAL